jgi:hypothetical protein
MYTGPPGGTALAALVFNDDHEGGARGVVMRVPRSPLSTAIRSP